MNKHYTAFSASAAEAFTKCVESLVIKRLDMPEIAKGISVSSDSATNITPNLNQRENGIC